MNLREVTDAMRSAEAEVEAGYCAVRSAADLCEGRLRAAHVPSWDLNNLKRELQKWDMHRGTWKE